MEVADVGSSTSITPDDDSLLLYLPVPLFGTPGNYTLDDQACDGLRLWADNFERVIAMLPVEPGEKPLNWAPISTIGPALERIEFVPLPLAYRPDRFLRHLPNVRREIAAQESGELGSCPLRSAGSSVTGVRSPASRPTPWVGRLRSGPTVWSPRSCGRA